MSLSKNFIEDKNKINKKYFRYCNKCKKESAELINFDGLCPSCFDNYTKEIKKLYKTVKE